MDWEEVRTRVGQEFWKRLDLTLYRAGLRSWEKHPRAQAGSCTNFFFGDDEIAHRCALLREHLPEEAVSIVQEADCICRHEFHLLGYEKIDYGREIDWHYDAVHGKRSPLKPWFRINYLAFAEVGDHKIIWELNRHQHLVTLAKAWRLTGDCAYADELVQQWHSWRKANPYPIGINWASALEVAFRAMSWLWVRNLLAGCGNVPADFEADLLVALQVHGRYIERYLSTYFSPNTHLLGEAVGLFFLGTLCPEISAAERWRNQGWKIILEESERQVRPDGVYFEQALYYHVYALDFFLHARHLASENGRAIPEQFDNILKKMLDVVGALSEVGPIEGFGDDDGGRVFNPRRNRVECMSDPLALGSILYDCENHVASGLTEEAIWLFGDKAVEACGRPRAQAPAVSKAFDAGGIYLINDHEPCAQQMMIDAGPQGTRRSGHGHADALSIRLSVRERKLLVDAGTCCYITDGEDRNSFRGTGAHNTLRVDGVDQAVPEGPFAWSSIPHVTAEAWLNGKTFDFFTGRHDGYNRLPEPVLHRRSVFHVKGGFWLVRDATEGNGSHHLESFWHFAPGLEVNEAQGVVLAGSSAAEDTERVRMALLFERKSTWKTEIGQGFVSPAYGLKQPAPVLKASVTTMLPEECAVLLLPVAGKSIVGTFAALDEGAGRGVRGYRYQTPHSTEFIFFARGNAPWTYGLWASDASLLYCRLEAGRLAHVIMVAGSFAEWDGRRFVSHPSVPESFEWSDRPGLSTTSSSADDHSQVRDFEILDSVP
jgi:hypothetical protein